jgi:hypothetical protein
MQGAKYDSARSTNDIAKAIRADIKAAMAKPADEPWALPRGLKVSVRLSRFAGGCSIYCRITAFPGPLLNPAAVAWQRLFPHAALRYPRLTRQAARAVAVLDGLMADYNYDRSDPQSDYFNVRFYGDAEVHSDYLAQRKLELASSDLTALLEDLRVGVAGGEAEAVKRTVASLNEGYEDGPTERRELAVLLSAPTREAA